MDIKWSVKLVNELVEIVSYLKKNKIGEILESLGNYFISEHVKYLKIENYTMEFSEEIDTTKISDGEFKLAFICELINSSSDKNKSFALTNKKKNKIRKIKRKKGFDNVYSSLSEMLKFCLGYKLKLTNITMNFESFYLTSILKEILIPEIKFKNKDDPNLEILSLPYFLTRELLEIDKIREDILYSNTSLILETQNLNLSILSKKQIREILDILNTKKTIFVRILLVLSFEVIRIENILSPLWLTRSICFNDYENFISKITSPLNEVCIFLTSFRIMHEKYFNNENNI